MNFYSIRDLRTESKEMFHTLNHGEDVIITNNGKPAALMIDINQNNFEEVLHAVRQAKAMIAFNSMRMKAAASGYMSEEEINAEIDAARNEVARHENRI